MKNFREYYEECFKAERPKFIRVLKAVPPDQAAYRPHPRSTCAGDLVWLLASELGDACALVDQGQVSYVARPAPTVAESVAAYERNAEDFGEAGRDVGRRGVGQEGPVPRGRQGGLGNVAGRHALRISVRRDSSSRAAVELPAADGREGALDLRSLG